METAAVLLRLGGLTAVPTETVYGLAANALDKMAVGKIYELKGRPEIKPLSIMIPDASHIDRYCVNVPDWARRLAKKYWPGPVTIVLESNGKVPGIVTAGGKTVALRCPDSPLTLKLLKQCDFPLACPSANPSGEKSPKTASEVLAYFDGRVEGILDGGPCTLGVESTIVAYDGPNPKVLRQGALKIDRSRLKIIGITGGTGSGKTTALMVLRKYGALVIDCDALYHSLLDSDAELLAALGARFPGALSGGKLERKALGGIVFSDEKALADLNAITHRFVGREVLRKLDLWALKGGSYAAVDAIRLIESGLGGECGAVVGVTAPQKERIRRIMEREGISQEYAQMRIRAQKPDSFFEENCGYILSNDGALEAFAEKCEALFIELLERN